MCALWHTGPQFYGKNLQFLWQYKAGLYSALKVLWQLHKHFQTLQYIEQWVIWLHILSGLKLLLLYSLNEAWSGVLAWWRWKEIETEKGRSSVYIEVRGVEEGFWGFNEYKLPLFFLYLLWALVLSAGWWVGRKCSVCSGELEDEWVLCRKKRVGPRHVRSRQGCSIWVDVFWDVAAHKVR